MSRPALLNKMSGPYQLVELVGIGGTAEVYRATHVQGGKAHAVKVLRQEHCGDRERVRAFREEFELLQGLKHAGIPAVRELREIEGRPAMFLEYLPGRTLAALHADSVRFDRVGALVGIIHIVARVHESGIVHNDIKLENFILQDSGRLTLVDFGNARRADAANGLLGRLFKRRRQVFGTHSYLAPECIMGAEATQRSDCYAIGVCSYILLTGRPPYEDERKSGILRKAVKEEATRLWERVPKLPKPLGVLLNACIDKEPEKRPADAGVLKREVMRHFGDEMRMTPTDLNQQLFEDFGDESGSEDETKLEL